MELRDLPDRAHDKPLIALLKWISALLYILYCLEVGLFLLILPWQSLWVNNHIVSQYPALRPLIDNAFLKGAVLGLGIVNIVIGIQAIAQLRKGIRR